MSPGGGESCAGSSSELRQGVLNLLSKLWGPEGTGSISRVEGLAEKSPRLWTSWVSGVLRYFLREPWRTGVSEEVWKVKACLKCGQDAPIQASTHQVTEYLPCARQEHLSPAAVVADQGMVPTVPSPEMQRHPPRYCTAEMVPAARCLGFQARAGTQLWQPNWASRPIGGAGRGPRAGGSMGLKEGMSHCDSRPSHTRRALCSWGEPKFVRPS